MIACWPWSSAVAPSGWWTVALTGVAGPLGSFGLALGLGRWAEATTGGMAVLAGTVAGLLFGAPLTALIVFGICLVTLLRGVLLRRWIALLIMLATACVQWIGMVIGLRLVGGMSEPQVGLVVAAMAITVVLGLGAYLALRTAQRAPAPPDLAG